MYRTYFLLLVIGAFGIDLAFGDSPDRYVCAGRPVAVCQGHPDADQELSFKYRTFRGQAAGRLTGPLVTFQLSMDKPTASADRSVRRPGRLASMMSRDDFCHNLACPIRQ